MTRYNYTGASDLFKLYYETRVDPWELDENERRTERREFMRCVTRGDIKQYLDYVNECLEDVRPVADAKSRCYDFELMRDYEQVKQAIIDFREVATI